VLAKAGLADPGRVRYFQDSQASDIKGGMAWAQLAAALNLAGEPGRARHAFSIARQRIDERDPHDYYGTPLRDRAALMAIAAEAGGPEGAAAIIGSVRDRLVARVDETTTQEQAWLVLAAHALGGGGAELDYSVDGEKKKAAKDPVVINPEGPAIAHGLKVKNEGGQPIWVQVTARGVPKDPLPEASQGLEVMRQFFTLRGEDADLSKVRQNDRLVVSIEGRNLEGGYHEVALLDLLPAGFEVESVINDDTVKAFPFLDKLSPTRMTEARDDRFFAAFELGYKPFRAWWEEQSKNGNRFHLAYIVRAVTPGQFTLPAVNASDMYAPRIYARTSMGSVGITPR